MKSNVTVVVAIPFSSFLSRVHRYHGTIAEMRSPEIS